MSEQRRSFIGKIIGGIAAIPLLGAMRSKQELSSSKIKPIHSDRNQKHQDYTKNKSVGFSMGNSRSIFILCSP